jgi:hypothetical protein
VLAGMRWGGGSTVDDVGIGTIDDVGDSAGSLDRESAGRGHDSGPRVRRGGEYGVEGDKAPDESDGVAYGDHGVL